MADVNDLIDVTGKSGPEATESLFPLVYDELRRIAAQRIAREGPGQTLQATALVHEVYLRLAAAGNEARWQNRAHFFGAAAEALRRILVENARRKSRAKRGGGLKRNIVDIDSLGSCDRLEEVLAVDEALARLEAVNSVACQLVKLRYFAGFTIAEVAGMLDISPRKADQLWAYARAWLLTCIRDRT